MYCGIIKIPLLSCILLVIATSHPLVFLLIPADGPLQPKHVCLKILFKKQYMFFTFLNLQKYKPGVFVMVGYRRCSHIFLFCTSPQWFLCIVILKYVFDVHVTVHRVKFHILKPTRCTNFSNLFLEWNFTCFGQILCPSSEVFFTVCTVMVFVIHVCWQLSIIRSFSL